MGEAGLVVRLGPWQGALADDARALRLAVFVREQRVPIDMEWDDADATALHAVAYGRQGDACGTGRLLVHAPGVARIGRMAVRLDCRSQGVGQAVLDALMSAARQRGDRLVELHAQCAAEGFYARAGFVPHGPVFDEAGIAHVVMRRPL